MKKNKSTGLPHGVTFENSTPLKKFTSRLPFAKTNTKGKPRKTRSPEQWLEDGKTLAIALLTGSACFLSTQIEAFSSFTVLLQEENRTTFSTYPQTTDHTMDFLPINMMAVRTLPQEDGTVYSEQIGVQYNKEEGGLFFEATSQLLKESLGNISSVEKINQEDFIQSVTTAPSLYFELFGTVPLDLLEKWLQSTNVQGNPGTTQRFALSLWQNQFSFFYQEGSSYFVCPISVVDSSRLESVLATLTGEPVTFAVTHSQLSRISPLTLWGGEPKETPHYMCSTPFDHSSEMDFFLSLLDFPASIHSQYTTDDAVVLRSGTDSIRLSYDGTVLFQGEGVARYVLPHRSSTITLQEQVEGCASFTNSLFQHMYIVPDVSLHHVETIDEETILSYYFSIDGIPLVFNHDVVGATFHLKGDEIHSFSLQYRQYIQTDDTSPTLPLEQVEAILQGLGIAQRDILFCYQDLGGDTMSAGWVIM